jgi:ESS family glutamate:Na+ symporter
MTVELSLLSVVSLAGLAFLLGEATIRHFAPLQKIHFPEPVLGGLLVAVGLLFLRAVDVRVEFPTSGRSVDFLVSLLTANMGLHITPSISRRGYPLLLLFLILGVLLFFVQLALVFPVALLSGSEVLPTALVTGPLSFVGAPFNLNPPAQTDPIAGLFRTSFPNLESVAQGMMMLGVLAGAFLPGVVGTYLFKRAGQEPPQESPLHRQAAMPLGKFALQDTGLIVLILTLITTAFSLQAFLLQRLPELRDDHAPVIMLSYALGAAFRLLFESFSRRPFPEKALTVLLLGPTMSLVLTYALMSVPLHNLRLLSLPLVLAGLLAIGGSVLVAWLAFPLFARFTNRYFAAIVTTVFLAVTTAWGPVEMSYLREFTDEEGPVEPMPVILP